MVIALLIVGILLTTAGIRGTEGKLATQFASDMTGTDGFIVWLGALVLIGLVGFIPGLQRPSRYLIALVVLVIVLRNGGVFQNFVTAIAQVDATGPVPSQVASAPAAANSNTAANAISTASSAASGVGGLIGGITSLFGAL